MNKLNWEQSDIFPNCPIWNVLDESENLIARIEYVPSRTEWIIQVLNSTTYHIASIQQTEELKLLAETIFERRLVYLNNLMLDKDEEENETYEKDCIHG
jgi:hypothetical protein